MLPPGRCCAGAEADADAATSPAQAARSAAVTAWRRVPGGIVGPAGNNSGGDPDTLGSPSTDQPGVTALARRDLAGLRPGTGCCGDADRDGGRQ